MIGSRGRSQFKRGHFGGGLWRRFSVGFWSFGDGFGCAHEVVCLVLCGYVGELNCVRRCEAHGGGSLGVACMFLSGRDMKEITSVLSSSSSCMLLVWRRSSLRCGSSLPCGWNTGSSGFDFDCTS